MLIGKGQGNNGNGHDAWAKYDYARLNEARIVKAEFTSKGFTLEGEGAGAYDASLGLKQFTRRITLNPNDGIRVTDSIAATGEHVFSEALHADGSIRQTAERTFLLKPVGDSTTTFTATLLSPQDAKAAIDSNVVMGPGIPGSVDKGQLEQRGERVVVTTVHPMSTAGFEWTLRF